MQLTGKLWKVLRKHSVCVIKSKSQSMNKDLLNSYQLGVAASCSNLKTVSKRQAAKRLGIRPSMVTKTLKSFCQAPGSTILV